MALATLLKIGSVGEAVTALQAQLKTRGFDPGPADGDFGPATEQAVRSFQQAQGLDVDGVVGVQTSSALGLAPIELPAPTLVALGLAAEEMFGLSVHECSAPGAPARWGPVHPVHSANSLHNQGRAFDAGGSTEDMRRFAAFLVENYTGDIAELIHNPNGSVKDRQRVGSDFWGPVTWAGHANHIHLAI